MLHTRTHFYVCECETGGASLLCGYAGFEGERQLHIFECVNAPLFNYFIDFFHHQLLLHRLTALTAFARVRANPANPQTGTDTCTTLQPDFSPEQNPGKHISLTLLHLRWLYVKT